jgi:hypothetical protein
MSIMLQGKDRREQPVIGLFKHQLEIPSNDVACILGLSPRQVRDLLSGCMAEGWLEISDPARKLQRYRLSAE